jgi:hypothetical protein
MEEGAKSRALDGLLYDTRVGLLRAAIADFLFNHKWSQQYAHEFSAYDLSQSAQKLDAELNPIVVAFNRDIAAYLEHLQRKLECRFETDTGVQHFSDLFSTKKNQTFTNDAILTVRTLSGRKTTVDTVTQSFFDATEPPSLTDVLNSITESESKVPTVLKANLSSNEAAVLQGILNSVQPGVAQVGRQLKLEVTPHSLSGAASAELDVELTAQEDTDPTYFKGEKSAKDQLSRVARHNVSTRVRVDSLKLFEISSFSALLARPRTRFPILPPFFEVPYFGSFLGLPLPRAKEYHRSTAVVSALLVPTSSDFVDSTAFSADRFVTERDRRDDLDGPPPVICAAAPCTLRKAVSPADLAFLPIRNFHKAMINCFATNYQQPYSGSEDPLTAEGVGFNCDPYKLNFHTVPPDYP